MTKKNYKILFVDDSYRKPDLACTTLEFEGYNVTPTISGSEAIKLALLETPDLILLDIMMPKMNGYETCEILKKNPKTKDIPVIFLSALNQSYDKVRGFEVGAIDYITKPYDIDELTTRVASHLTIAKLQNELQKSNISLKSNVVERTNELTKINFALNDEIQNHKQTKSILQDKETKLNAVFNNAMVGIVIFDTEGQLAFCNSRWMEMFGYNDNEINNLRLKDFVHPDYLELSIKNLKQIVNKNKGEAIFQKIYVRKDKSNFWGEIALSPIIEKDSSIKSVTGIITDITLRKNAEIEIKKNQEELENAYLLLSETNVQVEQQKHVLYEAIVGKDKFLSILAHDLKNPIYSVLGFAELLLKNHKKYSEEKREKQINYIYQSVNKISNLLEDLLTWSRSQSGKIGFKPEKFILKTEVNKIIDLLSDWAIRKNISIDNIIEDDLCVLADKNMVKTTFRNLISNAIKFTNHEGQITISGKISTNKAELSVTDNGIGMSKEQINTLFILNFQASTEGTDDEEGTGLGLLICKDFIEKCGGNIWVESEMNKGSSFKFILPI